MHPLARVLGLGCLLAAPALAQRAPASPVEVDRTGVLRWTASGREVALFGVNYAAPFAYDLRAITALGEDPKRAIDQDVAHLARLGVDAYRIHVWDREVSDREGNLLPTRQLDLLDYLIAQLSARGIKSLLTPIAWWGPGYPEPDPPSPGFSNGYSKQQMAVDTVVRKAQARYVAQFVAHVNPYTGRSYRDDPDIIAFEIFNEPWHDLSSAEETTRYIDLLVASMRATGLRKPIFYNISEHFTPSHGAAVCAANIQGVSAQWYPTGLVRGAALPGNPLPNVDRYPLPWKDFADCRDKAHMVYEFDGADVAVPVMYPAMARAFRGAGFQWATQFAYDPLAIAHTNTEYQTHYLNLVYTPAKAISFLIAGEVFRRTPRGFDAGTYPASARFGDFRLSYPAGSEMVTDTMFVHAGSTRTAAPSPASLRHVAGTGNGPVVRYSGTGAYFLDKLQDGIWRLEVYPDAVPVEEQYSRGNLRRAVTRVYWRTQAITIDLPDLGADFVMSPLDAGNTHRPVGGANWRGVRPGVYLVRRAGVTAPAFTASARIDGRVLGEFHAPPSSDGATVVRHEPPPSVAVGAAFAAELSVAQRDRPDSVVLFVRFPGWQGFRREHPLESTDGYTYRSTMAVDTGRTGPLEYVATVFTGGSAVTFPGAVEGSPSAWDFAAAGTWSTRVERRGSPIVLFDADRDRSRIVDPGYVPGARTRSAWIAGAEPERTVWLAGVDAFGPSATHVAFRAALRDGARERIAREDSGGVADAVLHLRVRAQAGTAVPLEVALTLSDGSAWGTMVQAAGSEWATVSIPLRTLQRVPLALIPRPYPTFLPYELTAGGASTLHNAGLIEGVQFGFRRDAGVRDDAAMHVEIASVHLQFAGGR
jgi:hypothetical protein